MITGLICKSGIFWSHCLWRKGAVLDFKASFLFFSEHHILLPSLSVIVESFKEILHIHVSPAFLIYLWFKRAFFLLLHLFVNPSSLYINILIASS